MGLAFQNEEPTRKIMLSENISFIIEVLYVNQDAAFLLPTFRFNNYIVLFPQMVTCLEIIELDLMTS